MCWRSAPTTSHHQPRPYRDRRRGRPADPRPRLAADAHRVGTKGARHYDWAMLEVTSDDTPGGHEDGHSMLLIRRHRYTGTLSFYRCWTPGPVPLSQLIAVAVLRWRIEEDHQIAKQAAGLDAGQVIRWRSWHRWTAICLLAYIYLATAAAVQRQHDPSPELDRADPHHRPRTAAAAARHRHPTTPARPGPQAALVILAATPPAPRPPSPPTLERLRRDCTMITTNYSRRIKAGQAQFRCLPVNEPVYRTADTGALSAPEADPVHRPDSRRPHHHSHRLGTHKPFAGPRKSFCLVCHPGDVSHARPIEPSGFKPNRRNCSASWS